MFPKINPREMKKIMKQLGMNMSEIDAKEVIILLSNGSEIKIRNPQVIKMKVQGKETFQISGDVEGEYLTLEISENDIKLVVQQTGVSEEQAKRALEEAGGDIAKAIIELEKEK